MDVTLHVNENGGNIDRKEIQEAIAKAMELRALHAALIQGNSPAHLKFMSSASSPPFSLPTSQFSAHDYPVFTPSYEDEPASGYSQILTTSQTICDSWEDNQNALSRTGLVSLDKHICPVDDSKSVVSSCTNYKSVLKNSPGTETFRSRRRNSLGDLSVSSCNKCKPATISTDLANKSSKHCNTMIMPMTDSHASMHPSQTKSRGMVLSWLFPRLKRRQKNDGKSSPFRTESEEGSKVLKGFGTISVEILKRELVEANQKRDSALAEVSEMRSSFGDLRKKLETLESYCEELKKALKQAVQVNSISKTGKSYDGRNRDNVMPVSEEVMVEGFLQIVSEARLSVKQFCKALYEQIDETDEELTDNLNQLLKPYKLSFSSRYSKSVLYHLESIINQAFFQDFENCVFQKNGTPKSLDPQQHRQAQFQSYAALRNLSWNEVVKKGTKYYCEEFSKFCDHKMSCIIMTLNWTRPWSGTLLESFFVAAKCIWLLHLLAFSFYPALMILRVDENRSFDREYMEDIFIDKQKAEKPSRVKVMVMPGFYVQDKILRCKVLCRYKSIG